MKPNKTSLICLCSILCPLGSSIHGVTQHNHHRLRTATTEVCIQQWLGPWTSMGGFSLHLFAPSPDENNMLHDSPLTDPFYPFLLLRSLGRLWHRSCITCCTLSRVCTYKYDNIWYYSQHRGHNNGKYQCIF